MVSEWNLVKDGAVVVTVERTPTSIPVLHADHPSSSTPDGFCKSILIGNANPFERHQNECGVINIRVEIVAELKRPSTRSRISILDLPVTGRGDLSVQQPF